MNPFLMLFSLITVISVVISGALLLSRRKGNGRWRSQEHIQSFRIKACGRPLRSSIGCRADQRLGFNEHGTQSFHCRCNGNSADFFIPL